MDKKYIFKDWRKIMKKILLILSLFVVNIVGMAYEKCNPKMIYDIDVNTLNGSYFGQDETGTVIIKLSKNAKVSGTQYIDEKDVDTYGFGDLGDCTPNPKITEIHIEDAVFNTMYNNYFETFTNGYQNFKVDFTSCIDKNKVFCKIYNDKGFDGKPSGIDFNQEVVDFEIHGNVIDVVRRGDFVSGYNDYEDLEEKRAKREKYIVNSPNGYVNFMRKPDSNSTIRGRVKNGKTVSLINEKSDWYYVQVLDGEEFGYVNKEYLKKIN